MRYAVARYKQSRRDVAYRIYVTDCLRMISESTAKCVNGGGYYMAQRFAEQVGYVKVDTRSGEEIAADIIKRAGLVVTKK